MKREKVIRDLIIQHGQAVLETVKALHQYIKMIGETASHKRIPEKEEALANRVLELEGEADRVAASINAELFRGAFLPVTSSDRYDLVHILDGIADRCEIVVRLLPIIGEPIPQDIKQKLMELAGNCVEATTYLVNSIQLMDSDFEKAVAEARKVQPLRERNRNLEFATLKILVDHKMRGSTLILLHDVIQLLGMIGDQAKRSADHVASMIIKYRT